MKFINKRTGVILKPNSDMVAKQLTKSPEWEEYVEKKPEQPKKAAKAKE